MGHLNSGYIDDSYLEGDTFIDTITLFAKLGFHIHPEKSVFIPSQKLIFFGFVLDSIAMTVSYAHGGKSLTDPCQLSALCSYNHN